MSGDYFKLYLTGTMLYFQVIINKKIAYSTNGITFYDYIFDIMEIHLYDELNNNIINQEINFNINNRGMFLWCNNNKDITLYNNINNQIVDINDYNDMNSKSFTHYNKIYRNNTLENIVKEILFEIFVKN